MKNSKSIAILAILMIIFFSCKSDKKEQPIVNDIIEISTDNIIDVVAKDFTFTVDNTIRSGWSTFRMKNTGMMDHFFY